MHAGPQPSFVTVSRFAEVLDVSVATVWRRIADGTFIAVRFGGATRLELHSNLARIENHDGTAQ